MLNFNVLKDIHCTYLVKSSLLAAAAGAGAASTFPIVSARDFSQ
jgi:hypothetical protein